MLTALLQAYYADKSVIHNYENILWMLQRLCQACEHPLLDKGFSSESINLVSTNMAKNLPNLLNLLETSNTCFCCRVSSLSSILIPLIFLMTAYTYALGFFSYLFCVCLASSWHSCLAVDRNVGHGWSFTEAALHTIPESWSFNFCSLLGQGCTKIYTLFIL